MSDFTSGFWHLFVAAVALIGIIGCAIFLWSQGGATYTIGQTTGHSWDENLAEFNNPLPKWWSWLFYITVVFSLVYLVLFPGLGANKGILGWTSHNQYDAEVDSAKQSYGPLYEKYRNMPIQAVAADRQALEMGQRLFMTYCIQCHGADAKGQKGFPNLTDNDWLYGGEPETIELSISNGRQGVMTPHAFLGEDAIKGLANYVRSVSGLSADPVLANRGRDAYMASDCSTCHGVDMKGNKLLGAPNLTNNIWLYGSSEEEIIRGITYGRNVGDGKSTNNRMPAWKSFLGEDKVHLLAAYVYSLSNK
ncbi:MAG: cytochrome-c oxidase, cbb3-type subunit III [Zoogloeaceae bacterium]|jgi:cytochrome c oxidase cbb3-type subunit 3|nr:cytochrome-c oxidase, cbb3-type subunit III [Zoogloeaceae bacterium]